MQLPTFIRLENSKEKALAYYDGPQMDVFSFAGVQLLSNNIFPYLQRTYTTEGIELEDVQHVYVCDLCGNRLADIVADFTIPYNFNDPATGLPQIIWKMLNVSFDAGYQMVYLEIHNGANNFVYSSPFMLTAKRGKFTSSWFYRNRNTDPFLSIGLQLYFKQRKSSLEISNYNPVSTGNTFTASATLVKFERWNTSVIDINVIETFKELFLCRQLYSLPSNFDGLPVRTGLNESFDSPDLEMDENFAEQEMLFIRNYSQTYDPNAPVIIPPPPLPKPPMIFITDVIIVDNNTIQIVFNYYDFPTPPGYFVYQFSTDGITWISAYGNTSTPATISSNRLDTVNNVYYYRIYYPVTGTYSNVYQIPVSSIRINNITSPDTFFMPSGNRYNLFYRLTFRPRPGTVMLLDVSTDGVSWETSDADIIASPLIVNTHVSSLEYKYFRLRYEPFGLISNIFNFQF